MNNNTNFHSKVMTGVAVFAGIAGGAWFIVQVASTLSSEIFLSLVAIASLIWLALIDLREGAPRGFDHGGVSRRFRRQFARKHSGQPGGLWQEKDRLAA